ncbi:MAG: reverse transcriptase domain-containing protein, partial [Candidatus Thiodiazotropha sp.]
SVNSSGKERLILDLRHVNQFIHKFKVKFEGCKEALDFCKSGYKMFKFDLKSGYYHVDINEEFQKYLGFSWMLNGKQRFFVYTVMAFGLSSAPFLFTKLLRPLVKYWRTTGISIIVYLDDGWGIDSPANSEVVSNRVRSDLEKAGFVLNNEKSVWKPCFILEWLGFIWNMEKGSIEIPKLKLLNLKELIAKLLSGEIIASARCLAKVAGKIISMSFSFGNICMIMTRNIQIRIVERKNWDSLLTLSQSVVEELSFWFKMLEVLPFRALFPLNRSPERIVFVDASDFAGAAVLLSSSNQVARYMFSESEAKLSSTYRELRALEYAIQCFSSSLEGHFVKVYTENQNVVRLVSRGSTETNIQSLAKTIFALSIKHHIMLEVAWVPRECNAEADFYSKMFDWDDWGVSPHIFEFFNSKWGPYHVDRFADDSNKKCQVFNSQFWTPGTAGVDAFAFDWSGVNNWLAPPVCLVPRVLRQLVLNRAFGTLVVPKWQSAIFWPLLIDSQSGSFNDLVVESVEYQKPKHFFVPGSDKNSLFAISPFVSNILVLRLDARRPMLSTSDLI